MFGNAYQNGPVLQVWDSKVNVDKNQFYKHLFRIQPANISNKYFDKDVKSYLYNLTGQNSKMSLPADDSKLLALHQQYLVLHVFVSLGYNWSLQLSMSDLNGIKRRINITTVQGKQQIKYFSFRYPLDTIKKNTWLFLAVDVYSFMQVFKDVTFRSLDQVTIGSNCKLRRIFTMKQFVEWEIPKHYWLSAEISQQLQLIQFTEDLKKSAVMEVSKQLTESMSSPKRNEYKRQRDHSQIRLKDENKKINKNKEQVYQRGQERMLKSQIIIENARSKLNNLQREEQLILSKSKELERISLPKLKVSKDKGLSKKRSSKQQKVQKSDKIFKNSKTQKQQKLMTKSSKNKIVTVQKAFKQDLALDGHDSSYSYKDSHLKAITPKQQNREIIEQDKWSSDERQESRPISQAISHLTGNFPSTVITKQNNKQIIVQRNKKQQLQLIYDQMVGCYYHPETNTYYQLKQ